MHYKAMGDLTHTGSLTDRIHQFLVSEYGSFYEAMRDLRNSSASFIALRYGVLTKQPAYSLDFINEYYRAAGVKSNLNPAVTHTRSGQATMVDSDGLLKWAPHNLLSYSEDFSNGYWSKTGATSGVDTLTEDTSAGNHRILNSGGISVEATTHTNAIEVKPNGRTRVKLTNNNLAGVTFNLTGSGSVVSGSGGSITALSDGWYLIKIELTSPTTERLIVYLDNGSGVSYTGDGVSGVFLRKAHLYRSDLGGMVNNPAQSTGLETYVPTTTSAVYAPRVGHHIYNGNAWVNEGVLHESEARTNLFPYSDMSTGWTAGNVAKSYTGETAPDGSASLHMTETAINGNHWLYRNPSLTASTQTMSVYAKAESRSWILIRLDGSSGSAYAYFNLGAGSIGTVQTGLTAQISDEGNGWYRCSATADSRADASAAVVGLTTGDGVSSYLGVVATGLYLSAAQLEVGSTPSSYIPTSGSTVTRAAETLTVPAANMPWPTPVEVTGTELVTNGTFDTDTSGWTSWDNLTRPESASQVNGKGLLDASVGTCDARQDIVVVAGKTYSVSVTMLEDSGAVGRLYMSDGANYTYAFGDFQATGIETTFTKTITPTQNTVRLYAYNSGTAITYYSNISIKEINPLSVSIQMDGKVTYAEEGSQNTAIFNRWNLDSNNEIVNRINTNFSSSGTYNTLQRSSGTTDDESSSNSYYTAGVNVPFNIASRHGSTFINGAVDGTALTADTTPTALPDLSTTDLQLGYDFMGTIGKFRVWSDDLTDTGIATATAPTFTTEFAMTIATTGANETFTIPCQNNGTFNAGIEWGDGSVSTVTSYNDANLTHTYATAGDHLIRIRGSFPNIYFNNGGDKLKVKSVENLGTVGWTTLNAAFRGCTNMTSFTAGTTDTSSVTDMYQMFRGSTSITSLDLSSFDTSSVTSMSNMFYDCTNLTTLDVSSFNTSSVTSMSYMFYNCSSLTSLDVSNFDTSSVTNMGSMFRSLTNLTSLDVSNFDTSSVTSMSYMFRSLTNLTSLDVSNFDTSSVTNMASMFIYCSSLTSLDVSNFDTSSVTNMSYMFYTCSNLTSLDVSNFDTSSVTSMYQMFHTCSSLTSLDVSNFDTSSVTSMYQMFYNCNALTSLVGAEDFDITGLNSTNDLDGFIRTGRMTTAQYDALLVKWDAQSVLSNLSPNFGASQYTAGSAAATARANLISSDGWTIADGGTA